MEINKQGINLRFFKLPPSILCYHKRRNYKEAVDMEKFIPYRKLSKKEKRKINQAKRQTWGELNPVTRKPQSSKAYNRRKAQSWKRDSGSVPFALVIA